MTVLLEESVDTRNSTIPRIVQVLEGQAPEQRENVNQLQLIIIELSQRHNLTPVSTLHLHLNTSILIRRLPVLRVRLLSLQSVLGPHTLRVNELGLPRLNGL